MSSMSSSSSDKSTDSGTADDGVKPQDAQTSVEKAKDVLLMPLDQRQQIIAGAVAEAEPD